MAQCDSGDSDDTGIPPTPNFLDNYLGADSSWSGQIYNYDKRQEVDVLSD